jgi:hypothetical protein
MFKKILTLLVIALSFGSVATIQAQSVTVAIGGSTSGAALTVMATKTDITCNGAANGIVTGVAAGGNGSFAYTIDATPANITGATTGIFTGLPAGTYVISATSAGGCSASATSVTVAEPTTITASITAQTNVNCFGGATGSVTVLGGGGTGASNNATIGYTIDGPSNTTGATSGIFTGLEAGNYIVTVTKGTCTTTQAVTITQPTAALAASFTPATVQIACGATTAASGTVNVTGGTPAYSYAWTAPASGTASSSAGLTAGDHIVTVTDNKGCTTTATVTVTAPNVTLSATVTPTQIVCNAGSPGASGSTKGSIAVTAVLPGAATPTYAWSAPATGTAATASDLAAGDYTVTISATGYCPVNYTRTINAAPAIVSADASMVTADGCQLNVGSVILTGKGGALGATYEVKWVSATLITATPARPAAVGTPGSGTYQASPATFSGLTGGYDYKFVIKDDKGCTTPE